MSSLHFQGVALQLLSAIPGLGETNPKLNSRLALVDFDNVFSTAYYYIYIIYYTCTITVIVADITAKSP